MLSAWQSWNVLWQSGRAWKNISSRRGKNVETRIPEGVPKSLTFPQSTLSQCVTLPSDPYNSTRSEFLFCTSSLPLLVFSSIWFDIRIATGSFPVPEYCCVVQWLSPIDVQCSSVDEHSSSSTKIALHPASCIQSYAHSFTSPFKWKWVHEGHRTILPPVNKDSEMYKKNLHLWILIAHCPGYLNMTNIVIINNQTQLYMAILWN